MRVTYAHYGPILGILIGAAIAYKVNIALGIIVGLVLSVIFWLIIRGIENAIYKLGDKAEEAIRKKIDDKRNGK